MTKKGELVNLTQIEPTLVNLLNHGKQILLGYNKKNGNFYLSEIKATTINFEKKITKNGGENRC